MWREQHGITLVNLTSKVSPWIAFGSLIWLLISIIDTKVQWQQITSAILLGVSFFILLFSLCAIFPYRKWKRDMDLMNESNTKTLNALTKQIDDLSPLRTLQREQQEHEGDWLHLVIQSINIEKDINSPERQITVTFNFDSGLVYDFKPYRIWLTPILEGYIPAEPQYEMKQTPNLLRCKRSQLYSIPITIKDDKLWELIDKARQGETLKKGLKVEVQPRINEAILSYTEELPRH